MYKVGNEDFLYWRHGQELTELELEPFKDHIDDWLKEGHMLNLDIKPDNKINFDLNNDGVVDDKDSSIAGKVLANARKKKF